jgi:hypothetical protein
VKAGASATLSASSSREPGHVVRERDLLVSKDKGKGSLKEMSRVSSQRDILDAIQVGSSVVQATARVHTRPCVLEALGLRLSAKDALNSVKFRDGGVLHQHPRRPLPCESPIRHRRTAQTLRFPWVR